MNRKSRRAIDKIQRNKTKQDQKLAEKISQFQNLPDECLACTRPFNKTDKEMVKTWNVVVRNDKETVRLYCPDCWKMATKVAAEYITTQQTKENENESPETI
jgi:uncharacterized protein with PIN domain